MSTTIAEQFFLHRPGLTDYYIAIVQTDLSRHFRPPINWDFVYRLD